jgi:hypothetical protein
MQVKREGAETFAEGEGESGFVSIQYARKLRRNRSCHVMRPSKSQSFPATVWYKARCHFFRAMTLTANGTTSHNSWTFQDTLSFSGLQPAHFDQRTESFFLDNGQPETLN